ncbi:DNA ligase D [Dokdonella sp.]|uniref:DNA ligase D n=1 Tax=Dokdonella sp. TaxID=2291710 RepID=UPI003C59793F
MSLTLYRQKRDFSQTSEPSEGGKRGGRIFVVQLHHASRRHYDFRLELDGVLKSWAVPKGPSFDPSVKRLAVEVEDHPLSYATFEGDIPEGNYGAGHVDVFDHGTWAPTGSARKGLENGDLKFTLHGEILKGSWVLVRTRMQGSKQQWLLIKHDDEYAGASEADDFVSSATRVKKVVAKRDTKMERDSPVSGRKPAAKSRSPSLPGARRETLEEGFFSPELCRAADAPPSGNRWLHEVKWDGYRILASVVDGRIQLWSRNGNEWTEKLPELVEALEALKLKNARLDGEIIMLTGGAVDFNGLQARFSDEEMAPVLYMLFDVVHAEGQSFCDVPLQERKAWLANRVGRYPHPLLRYSDHQVGSGAAVFSQAVDAGIEGIVSKRVDSIYSGTRSAAWVKSKGRLSDEFIVVGFTEPNGSRAGLGALLLAKPTADGGLRYVGRVGTGMSSEQLIDLRAKLQKTVVKKAPANTSLMARKDRSLTIWVKPKLVIEAFYQGIGGKGLLRQPAFKGIRLDKSPTEVSVQAEGGIEMDNKQTASKGSTSKAAGRKKTSAAKPNLAKKSKTERECDEVTITHPDRVVYPKLKHTKQDVADYYLEVAPLILPEIAGRPLSVVRCPGGTGKACFFQKHVGEGSGDHVHGVAVTESESEDDENPYLCIDDEQGLLELVQLNVLEFHPWGARSSDPENADRIVFDLDPHPSVSWDRVTASAQYMREQLKVACLESFLRTSGGKGLHVVVPIRPAAAWEEVRNFAKSVSEALAGLEPGEFVAVSGNKNRKNRIFVDWMRNRRGATSVASYSLRARDSAGVAMPLAWSDLKHIESADAINLGNAVEWIHKRGSDPWAGISSVRQRLLQL